MRTRSDRRTAAAVGRSRPPSCATRQSSRGRDNAFDDRRRELDTTVLDPPAPRLREFLAAARDQRGWAAGVALALLLGINLLVLTRISTTGTEDSTDLDRAHAAATTFEAPIRASTDSELDSLDAQTALQTDAGETWDPEQPPDPADLENHTRLSSGEARRVEAALQSEIDSTLPTDPPATPPSAPKKRTASTERDSRTATATPHTRGAEAPRQPSETIGGQGWIIETE